jgi:hypothetical protein
MLTITEEMRKSARKLLKAAKLTEDEYRQLAAKFSRPNVKTHINLADPKQLAYCELLEAAKLTVTDHKLLDDIANGTRKVIDERWWKEMHHAVAQDKLDKLSRLADPALNDNPHERDLASAKFAEFKGRRPPGARPEPRPLPKNWDEWVRKRKPSAKSAKRKTDTTDSVAPRPRLTTNSVAASKGHSPATDSVAKGSPKPATNSVAPNPATDSVAVTRRHFAAHR